MPRTCYCNDLDGCPRCRAYETHPAYAEWALLPKDRQVVCRHRGAETRRVEGPPGADGVGLKVFSCGPHGECTLAERAAGVKGRCRGCPDYDPDTFRLVAPRGTTDAPLRWEGRCAMKPWQHRVSVVLPHLDTLEPLAVAVELLRLQTERPYLLVIDTGSPPAVCEALERMRAEDLEVHYLKGHAYIQSSAPVSVAQDVAMALCRSEYLYCTHTDVFPRRRDLLEWLLEQTGPEAPVVGYGMSDRSWATDLWRECVGHQCLMLHVPTIRSVGVTWNMEHGYGLAGWTGANANGWPDTETGFSLDLRRRGLAPKILGREINFQRFVDGNIDHARTYTGAKVYLDAGAASQTEQWMRAALAEAKDRIREWSPPASPSPVLDVPRMMGHDLSGLVGRVAGDAAVVHDLTHSPANHYKLCSYLADQYRGRVLLDLGTERGTSALAFAAHAAERGNRVVTVDPEDKRLWKMDDLPIEYRKTTSNDPEVRRIALEAAVILLDVNHLGPDERSFLHFLTESAWKGVLIMDDVDERYFPQLLAVWREVPEKKYVLTPWCHWSGTGVVDYGGLLQMTYPIG